MHGHGLPVHRDTFLEHRSQVGQVQGFMFEMAGLMTYRNIHNLGDKVLQLRAVGIVANRPPVPHSQPAGEFFNIPDRRADSNPLRAAEIVLPLAIIGNSALH